MYFRPRISLDTYHWFCMPGGRAPVLVGLSAGAAPRVGRFRILQGFYLTSIIPTMRWHVQFRFDGSNHVTWHSNPEDALEACCLLIRSGVDVFGIGTGPLKDAVDREYVDRLYELWLQAKHSPRRKTG
jgi:hypothetical protein